MSNTKVKKQQKLPNINERMVVLDTETTGVGLNDHAIEIAAVELVNGKMSGKQFHIYLKPRVKMNFSAINTHKMDDYFYDKHFKGSYPNSEYEIIKNLVNFIGNSLIVAHNAQFDRRMLNKELALHGFPIYNNERWLCTLQLFKKYYLNKTENAKLSTCCEYFNIKTKQTDLHSAIYDAFICSRVLSMIMEKNIDDFNNNIPLSSYENESMVNDLSHLNSINLENKHSDNTIKQSEVVKRSRNTSNHAKNDENNITKEKRTYKRFDVKKNQEKCFDINNIDSSQNSDLLQRAEMFSKYNKGKDQNSTNINKVADSINSLDDQIIFEICEDMKRENKKLIENANRFNLLNGNASSSTKNSTITKEETNNVNNLSKNTNFSITDSIMNAESDFLSEMKKKYEGKKELNPFNFYN